MSPRAARPRLGLVLGLVLGLLPAGCGRAGSSSSGVVGVVAPRGRVGSLGLATGVDLALEAWTGDPSLVQVLDSRGTVRGAVEAFERLLERGATVVVGPPGTEPAAALARLAAERRVPLVLAQPPPLLLPEGTGRWVFTLVAGPGPAAEALAGLAEASLRLDAFAIVTDLADPGAQAFAEAFRQAVQARGGRVLAERGLVPDDPRGARGLAELLAAAPGAQGVLLATGPDDVEALVGGTDAQALAPLVLLGGPSWDARDLGPVLRGRVAGAYAVSAFSAADPSGRGSAFVTRYRQRTGRPAPAEAALGHDALQVALAAFEAGLEPDAVRRRLAATRDAPGVTGPTSFGPDGTSPRAVVVEQLHDGSRPRWVDRVGP